MNKNYLLSIVIPTRNHITCLEKSIPEIEANIDNSVQIVIQDNSDNNDFEKSNLLDQYNNIKYSYTNEVLSFVDNFDAAVSLADGEYLCMIGDDDGVTKRIVEATKWAAKNNLDSLVPEVLFEYFWPNSIDFPGEKYNNGIIRYLNKKSAVKMLDTSNGLKKMLHNGAQDYMMFDLVKLYHGIVKKSCLNEVKKRTGKYFGGLSPDIYISTALSIVCKKNYKISYPLTIAGVATGSGSANSSNGLHIGKLKDAPHFKGHTSYQWNKRVPQFYSVETIWADSALAALTDMKMYDLLNEFNKNALLSNRWIKHPEFNDYIENDDDKEKMSLGIRFSEVKYYALHVKHRLSRLGDKLYIVNDVPSILSANEYFENNYSNSNFVLPSNI